MFLFVESDNTISVIKKVWATVKFQNTAQWRHTLSSSIVTFCLLFICVFFFVNVPVFISCMLWVDRRGWFSGIWFEVGRVLMFAFDNLGGGGGRGSVALFWGRSANSGGGSWWWEWWWPKIVAGSLLTPVIRENLGNNTLYAQLLTIRIILITNFK